LANDQRQTWQEGRVWGQDENETYAQVFYKRAIGELPEMESSKAAAKLLAGWVQDGTTILDVGCGAGHYLRSFKNAIPARFSYTGADLTPLYIDLARKAFADQPDVRFEVADVFNLPFADQQFDIVHCSNVLLHLPSIRKPLQELCRVARKHVLIRTLVGTRSFRIQDVYPNDGDEFDSEGQPYQFHYFNIYSQAYVKHLLRQIPRVESWDITPDTDFDPVRIAAAVGEQPGAFDITEMLGGWQVNTYILQPWSFIKVTLRG
jgi:ubiquinone/menaquinone biosynthesis C-methylase UbiE